MLSALGIVFGVAAVLAILSVSDGARRAILAEVGGLGITRVSVRAARLSAEARDRAEAFQSSGLTLDDADAIAAVCPSLASIAPLREKPVRLVSAERGAEGLLVATTPSYLRTDDLELAGGRFLADLDVSDRKRTVVLGHELGRTLFPYEEPIGRRVRIDEEWYTVVGRLRARERTRKTPLLPQRDLNSCAFVPLTVLVRPEGGVDEIAVQIERRELVESSARLIRSLVARRHRGASDFEMVVPKELLARFEQARFQFTVVMGSLALISLLVGGIGIMNIMLANVSERTAEIGIRRSLGASRVDIVRQFLAEAVLLTTAGGAAGSVLGVAFSLGVAEYAGWPTAITLPSVLASLALAGGTGLFFGLYPARRAAEKAPMDALRHA
jgi:putative ABC transport system permease protein